MRLRKSIFAIPTLPPPPPPPPTHTHHSMRALTHHDQCYFSSGPLPSTYDHRQCQQVFSLKSTWPIYFPFLTFCLIRFMFFCCSVVATPHFLGNGALKSRINCS